MSGIAWISLNEGVYVGVSCRCGKKISEYMHDGPSIELTRRAQ